MSTTEILVTYGVFIFIIIMGIAQILISNSVIKQTAGSKVYDANNVGRSSRRLGYGLVIMGLVLIVVNVGRGSIYKLTSIAAGICVGIVGLHNAWLIHKKVDAAHPLKEGQNTGHLTVAILQILFGILAIVCGL